LDLKTTEKYRKGCAGSKTLADAVNEVVAAKLGRGRWIVKGNNVVSDPNVVCIETIGQRDTILTMCLRGTQDQYVSLDLDFPSLRPGVTRVRFTNAANLQLVKRAILRAFEIDGQG
jgi:hypothetical protein